MSSSLNNAEAGRRNYFSGKNENPDAGNYGNPYRGGHQTSLRGQVSDPSNGNDRLGRNRSDILLNPTSAQQRRSLFSQHNFPYNSPDDELDDPRTVPIQNTQPQLTQRNFSKLQGIMEKYEINPQMALRLEILADCEVVVLCDDSGSMRTPVDTGAKTRWDELQQIVTIVVDVCSAICPKGIDVFFLNRNPVLNVRNHENIQDSFVKAPYGLTPLSPALRKIFSFKKNLPHDKKLLILIATDGAPTDPKGEVDIATLESILRNERPPYTYISFLVCTDDPNAVSYLNGWDKSMSDLDVVDDYISERAEVQQANGPKFPFSFGDYIAKALIGSLDSWLGDLDGQ